MSSHPPILIAGGGIGGLAAALALAKIGRKSVVLERNAGASEAGAGIQLGPNATKALRQLGVASAIAPFASYPDALAIRRGRDGQILTRAPLGGFVEARYGAPYWVVHRADLHRVLADAAAATPDVTIVRDFDAATASQTAAGPSVTSSAGRTLSGAALIGADGVWSRTRAAIAPAAKPIPSGHIAFRTLIPTSQASILAASDVGAWLAPKAHVVHYPVHAGRSINVVVIVSDAWQGTSWNAPAEASDVARATQSFSPELQGALAAAPGWHKWSLTAPLQLDTWANQRIALLGDAAHPVLPFLAQGGAMALEDAVQLAASIAGNATNLSAALVHYATTRQARVARVQSTATRNGQIFHLSGPLAAARDLALRTLPASTAITRLDWLYGFDGPELAPTAPNTNLKP